MSTIVPEDQALRNAVRWISDKLQEGSEPSLPKLVQEATFRYDLTPNQGEYLLRFYRKEREDPPPG